MDDISDKRKEITSKFKRLIKSEDKSDDTISIDREKVVKFLKTDNIYWILMLPVLALAYFVRTRNLPHLQGKYLLGLDPYAFFRYAQEIVQTGTMVTHDMMRYVPLGYNLRMDYKFVSYVLAYSYKIINTIMPSVTQLEWHIIYPVVATVISLVFLFLFVKEIFGQRVAIVAAAFLAVIPGYIYRTGAGFADHEAIAMVFMFAALWFFALMWHSKNRIKSIMFGTSAGILSAFMYFSWPGGYRFLIVSLVGLALMATILTKLSKNQLIGYLSWFASFVILSAIVLGNISFIKELENLALLLSVIILLANKIKPIKNLADNIGDALPYKIPGELIILGGIALIAFIAGWALGLTDPSFVIGRLLHPGGTSRFAFTVSENQQPYFIGGNGWWSGFGWTFLLAFFGSIYMVTKMFKSLKVGLSIAASYSIFFIIFIFGRFSPDAKYAKIAEFSTSTYLWWFGFFIAAVFGLYIYYYNKDKHTFSEIFNVDWSLLLIFIWFLFTAIIARGAVRTIFAFGPAVAIVAAYFTVNLAKDLFKHSETEKVLAAILIIFAIFCFYSNTVTATYVNSNSGSGLPGQWESSMTWIRDNTQEDAVIAHWWDYGYWTQTIGERATVVDGGNAMAWDHGMGRYGLTHNNLGETFDYFKTHEVTHLLISEEEIGKYHAFATIGSDEDFDRRSTIGMFSMQGQNEIRDGFENIYQGYWGLDQDLVIDNRVLPQGTPLAGISMIVYEDGSFEPPVAHFIVGNNQQLSMNINCVVNNGIIQKLQVEEPSLDACVTIIPYYVDEQNINPVGAMLFASSKVKDGNLARLYFYDEKIPGFNKVYDDGTPLGIYRGSIIGPIRIWEIDYPANAKADDKYLEKSIYG
jgi:asparagine N-glycosylation enzyme membrane subunit Stt3